jgi:hypothetical protein
LRIIQERDKTIYKTAIALIDENNAKPRNSPDINKPNKKDVAIVVNSVTKQSWDKLTLIKAPAVVFMQVNKNTTAADAKTSKLQDVLKANKFTTPAREVITAYPFKDMVKFYYEEDRPAAEKILALSKSYFKDLKLVPLNNPQARKGLIELWGNYTE